MSTAEIPDLIDDESEICLIVKGRFKAGQTKTYGIFIVFLNSGTKSVENQMAIASHYSSIIDIDPDIFVALLVSVRNLFKKDTALFLNDQSLALIESSTIRFPLNPTVKVIGDSQGNNLQEQKMIDLTHDKRYWIKEFVHFSV